MAIFAVFLACFFTRASQPPLADEVVFFLPLEKWLQTGPERWGVWHTPLYPWVLYLISMVFGLKVWLIRTVGLVCVSLGLGLIYRAGCIFAERMKKPFDENAKTVLWALLFFQPIALGSALLIDYDTTFLFLSTAWFFYLLALGERRIWVLGLALGFCLLGKETTPLIYPLGIWVASGSFVLALASAVFGAAFFGATVFVWCWHYHVPFFTVFEMGLLGLHTAGAITGAQAGMELKRATWIKISPMFWVGAPLLIFLANQVLKGKLFKGLSRDLLAVLAVIGGAVFVYTFALKQMTYHFPKYMSPLLVWLPVFGVIFLNQDPQLQSEKLLKWKVLGVSIFWCAFPGLYEVLYQRSLDATVYWTLAVGGGFGILWLTLKAIGWGATSFSVLLMASNLGFGLNYAKIALTSDRSITYWFGDRAIGDAREWIRAHPGIKAVSPAEDIAYVLSRSGVAYSSLKKLQQDVETLCRSSEPVAVLTRKREATSIRVAPELEGLRNCLTVFEFSPDLVIAARGV